MFTPEMSSFSSYPASPVVTLRDQNLGLFAGMTGGKRPGSHRSVVENFPIIPSDSAERDLAWVFWGKPARSYTIDDLALRGAIHNPHALLTLLPNISLSIYKGLP